jgi:hypothetical protein
MQDMMYGSLPKVEASRTNADAADDVARVGSEMIERLINLDIQDKGQDYDSVLRSVLQDRLLPGLGCARVRYDVETEGFEVPGQFTPDGTMLAAPFMDTRVVWEDAPVEYCHWQDVLWGWGRSFAELPWIAFKSYLSKDQIEERFGEEFVDQVEYKKQKVSDQDEFGSDQDMDSPWNKAEVWEIWDKEMNQVVWYSQGADKLLDKKEDPLQLANFFPCPPFLLANPTTTLYVPTADYHMAQDLYNEVDRLQTRIAIITEAVKVVGVYDAHQEGVKRMLDEGVENDLIPVDNWAMFAESGGIKGSVDWFPLESVVATLNQLIGVRDQTIQLLQQVNGMSDIMQGGLSNQYEGTGQTQIKAQFGSVRVQSLQDQFAQFAGNLLQIKAEVICRHFEPKTIVEMSNMQFSNDQDLIMPAVELLKKPEMAHIRITVRPETVAMVDYARLKSDRTEFLNAMATFMQSAAPMLEREPDSMPYLLKMLQWSLAGFKGSQEIEGVMDKAVEGAIAKIQQAKENPQPDPEQQAAEAKLEGELRKIQEKGKTDMQLRQADMQADMQTVQVTTQAKQGEIMATHQARMKEISFKLQADLTKEQAGMEANIAQTEASADTEIMKDAMNAEIDIEKEVEKAMLALDVEDAKSSAKLREIMDASNAKLTEMITNAALTPAKEDSDSDGD